MAEKEEIVKRKGWRKRWAEKEEIVKSKRRKLVAEKEIGDC